ncbi:carbohydrate ABC transporter permease [Niallia taxi]|uniref:carbohydrate ABC transporter permease n=1 Tax=Niallia taxi TaxID=2499688 RepID=UPI0011A38782|nr:carbohydrate ABC transporter permease [Niallia taxi]MCM3213153.1 carbohydrate ABC transporter permease [Niallia taxi]MDE5052878.1 carbohydrate ABC transporter permease [Niallia taxi]MED3965979.1 carbohydrate ABC transporter permease [Niallia taxi]
MKGKYEKVAIHSGIIVFLLVTLAPLAIALSTSFKQPGDTSSPLKMFTEFSFESYKTAFFTMNFGTSFLNSLITTFGSVFIIVILASMAAYPLARMRGKLSKFLYILFIAGLVIPGQMVVIPIAQVFDTLNIPSNRFTPMIMFITCSIPFSVFLYTGFMKTVPVEIEESAYLDGANLFTRFFKIVFPLLSPATVSVVITQGIWIWNDYFYPLIFVSKQAEMSLPVTMLNFLGDKENPAQWSVLFAACILCAIPLIIAFALLQKHFVSGISSGAVKG